MMASADKAAAQQCSGAAAQGRRGAAAQRAFTAMMKLVKLDISALARIRQPVTIATRRALAICPEIDDEAIRHRLLFAIAGYVVVAFASYFLAGRFSSNTHDRSVEAAMTSVFFFGPVGAVVAFLFGLLSGRSNAGA